LATVHARDNQPTTNDQWPTTNDVTTSRHSLSQ